MVLLATAGALAGTSQLRFFADVTENARNSFDAADMATLKRLDKRLTILVRLAPEDPRYLDLERKILGTLRRTMQDVVVKVESESRSGLFEGASESYGTIRYRYAGKEDASRSTGTGEVLPLIYGLAGVQRAIIAAASAYPGYPLQADPRPAQVWFYGVLPLLIVLFWGVARGFASIGSLTAVRDTDFERRQPQQEER